jgi:uncharacterized protein YggE
MRAKYGIVVLLLVVAVVVGGCGSSSTPAVAAGGGNAATYAQVSPVNGSYATGITVVGTGVVEAAPDIVYVTLGVDLKAEDPAAVVRDAGTRMDQLLTALKGAGVAEADIHTAGYNLWVEQQYDPQTGQPTGVTNYHVSHTIRFAVRDLTQVGTILSTATGAGANTVSEVSFTVADTEKLASQARQKALADAQARAQEMAQVLGVSVGKPISVSETSYYPTNYDTSRSGLGGEGMAQPVAVPMPSGSFSVSVSVVMVYEIQ